MPYCSAYGLDPGRSRADRSRDLFLVGIGAYQHIHRIANNIYAEEDDQGHHETRPGSRSAEAVG